MSDLVAVTVIGNDRPGIVAGIAEVLYETGCNLEDVTSTILRGHFSMTLIVNTPDGTEAVQLEERLRTSESAHDLVVVARSIEDVPSAVPSPTHMISVYGADKPGIVYRVAAKLAADGANVTDLTSRLLGEENAPVYALMLEVAVPPNVDVEGDLAGLKEELGVDITVRPIDPDLF